MPAELDGPRLAPKSGPARQLVVFLHGYGADGNDLIEIGRAWQALLCPTPRSPRRMRQGHAARRRWGASGFH
jgi:phospholipase/carboxylesterase